MSDGKTYLVLATGQHMPYVGLGTWQSKPGEVEAAVLHALKAGYRHIDCAAAYQNEGEVGRALKAAFEGGVCKREDVFVTSKLWNTYHAKEHVEPALRHTLQQLQLEYLDLYLIHWPQCYAYTPDRTVLLPKAENSDDVIHASVPLSETWDAMEAVQQQGLTRAVGVSNFNEAQLAKIVSEAKAVKPAVLQIESHPYFLNESLIQKAKELGVVVTAYCPLGSPNRPWAGPNDPALLDDPKLVELGKKLQKTPAQIVLRFQIQRGVIVIPKSVTPSRIEENFGVDGFVLSDEDMAYIRGFDRNWRLCNPTKTLPDGSVIMRDAAHPDFPFKGETV